MGVCNCSMFCYTLLCVRSSIAIILMGKRELVALLNLSSWCPVMVERLFLAVPQGCLRFVIVVFPDHTHLLFITMIMFPCGLLSTKFNIKQNYTVKLSLIGRNNSNKNPNELLKSFHLDMSIIQYYKCKGSFLLINLSLLNI